MDYQTIIDAIYKFYKAEPGPLFADDVMRRVRQWESPEQRLAGSYRRLLARWIYPALSLSMAAFMAAFYLAAQPASTPEDALLLGSSAQVVTADWQSNVSSSQLSDIVENP